MARASAAVTSNRVCEESEACHSASPGPYQHEFPRRRPGRPVFAEEPGRHRRERSGHGQRPQVVTAVLQRLQEDPLAVAERRGAEGAGTCRPSATLVRAGIEDSRPGKRLSNP